MPSAGLPRRRGRGGWCRLADRELRADGVDATHTREEELLADRVSSVFVPVAGEENTFATRAVKVGRPVGGMVPVESGLKEGEQVVVSGTFILKADLGKAGAAHEH